MKKILILGVNGFVGYHLSRRILNSTPWQVYGMDTNSDRVSEYLNHERFNFFEGDITINREWVEYHVKKCDIVIPLVAVATPSVYITDPLRVFELDFEANLPVVRAAVKYQKRLIFPSTSEVYGMSMDEEFDPDSSSLVYGPIKKSRWIYACSKQLMDRVIFAYGQQHGLKFTLFRPFNWIGPRLDNLHATKEGSSRVVTQFLGQILRGEDIQLVDGGLQRRCFTCVDDGIELLVRIIENKGGVADGKIYNIGNPENDYSIKQLAEVMLSVSGEYVEFKKNQNRIKIKNVDSVSYYGAGYQDASRRVPSIRDAKKDFSWLPTVGLEASLRKIFSYYSENLTNADELSIAS